MLRKRFMRESFSLQNISDKLVTAIWIYDVDNYCMYWANKAALTLWQSPSLSELKSRDFKLDTSEAVKQTLCDYQHLFEQKKTLSRMWEYNPQGVIKEVFCQMSGFVFDNGQMGLLCEALPADVINDESNPNSVVMLSTYDFNGKFISGNPPFIQIFSKKSHSLYEIFIADQDRDKFKNFINSTPQYQQFEEDVLIKTVLGARWHRIIAHTSHNNSGNKKILVQQFDINSRKMSELAIAKEAITDPLTGLLNRRGLLRELNNIIKNNETFIIFYIDLDGFKMINDSLGHTVGDHILKSLAQRLLTHKSIESLACRYGGDEFIWVINQKDIIETPKVIANLLLTELNKPYFSDQLQPMLVSASIGIASYPDDGCDISKLILRADAAMYLAKKQGKRRWVNYIEGMESGLQQQSEIAQCLFVALKQHTLMLYYQPIYNVDLNDIDSFEALLRLYDPELGWISPEEIICVAEEVGIITELEYWIIKQAIMDLLVLRQLISPNITMAINISGVHFTDPKLISYIVKTLEQYNLPLNAIVLELTESALLSDISDIDNSVTRFIDAGFSLSIDDFGTGFSSLAYLHKIPAKIVKIDQSFTNRIEDCNSMVESIHQLIKKQGFTTLIEGVSSMHQSLLLKNMGIFLQQGYALGKPKPLDYYQNNISVYR